jgi:hypothetical protein
LFESWNIVYMCIHGFRHRWVRVRAERTPAAVARSCGCRSCVHSSCAHTTTSIVLARLPVRPQFLCASHARPQFCSSCASRFLRPQDLRSIPVVALPLIAAPSYSCCTLFPGMTVALPPNFCSPTRLLLPVVTALQPNSRST